MREYKMRQNEEHSTCGKKGGGGGKKDTSRKIFVMKEKETPIKPCSSGSSFLLCLRKFPDHPQAFLHLPLQKMQWIG
jgi:hypothetical protein